MSEPMALAYEERGSGPVLVFVHGFPLDRTMWIDQLAGLAKIRRAVAVDLRGHGLSRDPQPELAYSIDMFADDLAATLDELGADRADICGLSMGGYVVFSFWRRHPDRVRSLIFCDTKAEADTPEGKEGREKTAQLVQEKGMRELYLALEAKMFGSNPSDDVKTRTLKMFLGTPAEVAAADALAMRDRPDSTPDLPGIGVPVLWIHGKEDALMPVEAARTTAEKIPGALFVTIPRGGHMAPMENPDAVNAAIRKFLKGAPRSG